MKTNQHNRNAGRTGLPVSKVIGMGNALVDLIFHLESDRLLKDFCLPKGSMTLIGQEKAEEILGRFQHKADAVVTGGSASNTITAIARMGGECGFIGRTGSDDRYANFYKDFFGRHHIRTYFSHAAIPTGTAITLMSPDTERTFATYLGAAATLSEEDIEEAFFKDYDFFHIEGYMVQNQALMEKAVSAAKRQGLKVSLDMASYNIVLENREFLDKLLRKDVDIVFANEEEAAAFTGKNELEALCRLAEWVPTAIVKLGSRGSLVMDRGRLYHVEAEKVTKIDSNGAGDNYAAGFLYGLCCGLPARQCGEIASMVATEAVKVTGPKLSEEQWEKILPRIETIKMEAERR